MPGFPRTKGKATDIAFKILGVPQNLKEFYGPSEKYKPRKPKQVPPANPYPGLNR